MARDPVGAPPAGGSRAGSGWPFRERFQRRAVRAAHGGRAIDARPQSTAHAGACGGQRHRSAEPGGPDRPGRDRAGRAHQPGGVRRRAPVPDINKWGPLVAVATLCAALLMWRNIPAMSGPLYLDQSRPTADRVDALLSQMTLAEKVGQMDQILVTLLKNTNNVLPLASSAKVLVTGPNADSMVGQLGGWSVSWQGVFTSGHTCCEAPRAQRPPGTTFVEGVRVLDPSAEFAASHDEALAAANGVDFIIAAVGELAYAEGLGDNPAPALPPDQQALLSALESTSKPVVVVVMAGRPVGLGASNERNASAIVM